MQRVTCTNLIENTCHLFCSDAKTNYVHSNLYFHPNIKMLNMYIYCNLFETGHIHSKLSKYIQLLLQNHKNNIYCQILTRKQKSCKVMQIPMRIQDCIHTHLHINGIERK